MGAAKGHDGETWFAFHLRVVAPLTYQNAIFFSLFRKANIRGLVSPARTRALVIACALIRPAERDYSDADTDETGEGKSLGKDKGAEKPVSVKVPESTLVKEVQVSAMLCLDPLRYYVSIMVLFHADPL